MAEPVKQGWGSPTDIDEFRSLCSVVRYKDGIHHTRAPNTDAEAAWCGAAVDRFTLLPESFLRESTSPQGPPAPAPPPPDVKTKSKKQDHDKTIKGLKDKLSKLQGAMKTQVAAIVEVPSFICTCGTLRY